MTRTVDDVLTIMRRAISRPNQNDPDSSTATLLQYLNDVVSLSMSDDVKLFELRGTLEFTVDQANTTGVYTFNDVGATDDFVNISMEAFVNNNPLLIYQDPGQFYGYWNQFDTTQLTAGQPTEMLYYGNEFVFRTIPDQEYTVRIFGYKQNPEFSNVGNPALPFDNWLRYLAYYAAYNYAIDFRYSEKDMARIKKGYFKERKLLLTRTHNQVKLSRGKPRV